MKTTLLLLAMLVTTNVSAITEYTCNTTPVKPELPTMVPETFPEKAERKFTEWFDWVPGVEPEAAPSELESILRTPTEPLRITVIAHDNFNHAWLVERPILGTLLADTKKYPLIVMEDTKEWFVVSSATSIRHENGKIGETIVLTYTIEKPSNKITITGTVGTKPTTTRTGTCIVSEKKG